LEIRRHVSASHPPFVFDRRDARSTLVEGSVDNDSDSRLLEAAQFGFPDAAKRERAFDKSIARALQDIEDARAEIVKAALVADEP
jgi:hypothetical protein